MIHWSRGLSMGMTRNHRNCMKLLCFFAKKESFCFFLIVIFYGFYQGIHHHENHPLFFPTSQTRCEDADKGSAEKRPKQNRRRRRPRPPGHSHLVTALVNALPPKRLERNGMIPKLCCFFWAHLISQKFCTIFFLTILAHGMSSASSSGNNHNPSGAGRGNSPSGACPKGAEFESNQWPSSAPTACHKED